MLRLSFFAVVLALVAMPAASSAQAPLPPALEPTAASQASASTALGAPARFARRVGAVEVWIAAGARRLEPAGRTPVAALVCVDAVQCDGAAGARVAPARKRRGGIRAHNASHLPSPNLPLAPFALASAAVHTVTVTTPRRRKGRRAADAHVQVTSGGFTTHVTARLSLR